MSYSATPGSVRMAGSMSRGTARSMASSGRPVRSPTSAGVTRWCGAWVAETTTSAAASSCSSRSMVHRRAAEAAGEVDRAIDGAVDDAHRAGAAGDEAGDDDLGRLAGADHEHRGAVEAAEGLVGEAGGDAADRHGGAADGGLVAHAARRLDGRLEQPREDRPRGALDPRQRQRLAHLAEHLGLALDDGVEARRRRGRCAVPRARRGGRRSVESGTGSCSPAMARSSATPSSASRVASVPTRYSSVRLQVDTAIASSASPVCVTPATRQRLRALVSARRSRTSTGAVRNDAPTTTWAVMPRAPRAAFSMRSRSASMRATLDPISAM